MIESMNIMYIIKGNPESLPPVLNQIKILNELGHKITLICDDLTTDFANYLTMNNINYYARGKHNKSKITNWIFFRKYVKKIKLSNNSNLVFFGSLDTAMACTGLFKTNETVLNIWELYDRFLFYKIYMKLFLSKFPSIICPEYNRSVMLKLFYRLNKNPLVLPNKPEFLGKITDISCINQEAIDILNKLSDKKIVLYQGQIYSDRQLDKIAFALSLKKSDDYYFVLMGIDHENSVEKLINIYNNTVYLGYIPAPAHLEITKRAYIGIVNYSENSLNNVYCAPNKIYEYGAFSKPMIGNDIPGLKYTIEYGNCGVCIDFGVNGLFEEALNKIDSNYKTYSENSKKLFESVNNKVTLEKFLDSLRK